MPRCVAVGCNNNGSHHFPRDPSLRKLWVKASRIKKKQLNPNSKLCSKHFKKSDFQDITATTGLPYVCKRLRKAVVPSIFSWSKRATELVSEREKRYVQRNSKRQLFLEEILVPEEVPLSKNEELQTRDEGMCIKVAANVPDMLEEFEISCGLESVLVENSSNNNVTVPACRNMLTQTPHLNRLLCNNELLSDSKSVKFYTGLESYDKFKIVLLTLLPMAHHITYRGSEVLNISVEDQFLLMLIKLRRNKCDFELSKIFNIGVTEVGNVFVTWVNFAYQMWSTLSIWPSRGLVSYYMPNQFKMSHKSTRVIVDGTEVPIARPKNPKSQQATFSSYKHHNTIKFLVGSTPGGLLSYCSEGYAGSTSDRQIVERSTLLDKCEANDAIMADRGFNVQDIFASKDVSLLIPNFLKGISQLPGVKLEHDRKIAANRIHIERLIGLAKTYIILKSDINPFYVPLLSKIFFVCMMLCNFKEKIVN